MKSDHGNHGEKTQSPLEEVQLTRLRGTAITIIILLLSTLACSFSVDLSEGNLTVNNDEASPEVGIDATAAQDTEIPTEASTTASPTATASPQPTQTQTPTPEPVMVGVGQDTYCRTGPASNYERKGILTTDQTARAVARDPGKTSWLIVNPENATGVCWIWGRYATPQGPADTLPVYTPPPSPTPEPVLDFNAERWAIIDYGSGVYIWFKIQNTGDIPLESVQTIIRSKTRLNNGAVQDQISTSIYNGFSNTTEPNKPNAPRDNLDKAEPGLLVKTYSGKQEEIYGGAARVTMTICSRDNLQGTCVTKTFDIDV